MGRFPKVPVGETSLGGMVAIPGGPAADELVGDSPVVGDEVTLLGELDEQAVANRRQAAPREAARRTIRPFGFRNIGAEAIGSRGHKGGGRAQWDQPLPASAADQIQSCQSLVAAANNLAGEVPNGP